MTPIEELIQELDAMERRLIEIDKTLIYLRLKSPNLHITNASDGIGRAYGGLRDAQRSFNMFLKKGAAE